MKPTKVKPSRNFTILMAALVLLALLVEMVGLFFDSELGKPSGYVLVAAIILSSLVVIFDLAVSWLPARIQVERFISTSLALGKWVDVRLELTSTISFPTSIHIRDSMPQAFVCPEPNMTVNIKPNARSIISYKVKPLERGEHSFNGVHVEKESTLRLWCVTYFLESASTVRVYPNFEAVSGYSLLHVDNQTAQLGIKKKIRRGEGMDFLQLREYREGDSLRQIDWKASSRYQKLISQEYQDARDQQVMVMLDSGRRMRTKDDELSHFDHSLNATLLLSHIAAKQGDSVGVYSFGADDRYVAPFKGAQNIQRLLNELYDLYPSNVASDYMQAAKSVVAVNQKRSLVVIVTNLRDEDLDDLAIAVKLLKKKHLVLVANLYEGAISAARQQAITDFKSAALYAGVQWYTHQTQAAAEQFRSQGIWMITCKPEDLSIRIVNSYLQIKNSGAL